MHRVTYINNQLDKNNFKNTKKLTTINHPMLFPVLLFHPSKAANGPTPGKENLSHEKTSLCICENKGADQLRGNCLAMQISYVVIA